jgi:hypothetical protein
MDLSEANRVPAWNPRGTDTLGELSSIALLVLFACFVLLA